MNDQPSPDDVTTATTEQGLTQTLIDRHHFGGNLFAQDIPFATSPSCDPGFVRSNATPTTTWSSALGGFCTFVSWVTPNNLADCRANMLAHTPGGFSSGDCETHITEQMPDAFSYSVSNTNSAQVNTANHTFTAGSGQTLTIGTCGVSGASFSGDTYLRLYGPDGSQVAFNDDSCGGLGSKIVVAAPLSGFYEIRGGCFSNSTCNATVAWTVQ